ncbi:heme-dependent oxidative N-demethylase family protein [Quadrisphaera granulorum]|uniref:heme-dependent oxidative N-demethylase family protein n=1 Tax=Quadrisphaera granulorum TaxID=317664 RepID=UPI003CCC5A43
MSLPTSTAADLLEGFPFPFSHDSYRYSTNVEPARSPVATPVGQWGASVVTVDSEYHRELAERAVLLERDPSRYGVLPHMEVACWDAMLVLLRELASARPDAFHLDVVDAEGPTYRWRNDLLGIEQTFVVGRRETLPAEPLAWACQQVQEDVVLLDQRSGELYGDAGVVTFAADWSFGFDLGMTFLEIHGPVPRVHAEGVIPRAREFILRLQPGQVYRRTNWTLTVGRRLDVATETYPEWGPDRAMVLHVDDDAFGHLVHLRVEVQHLLRLPESGAVMFLIRTHLLPLADIARVPAWRERTAAVLTELPQDMADYKGIAAYRSRAAAWLRDCTSTTTPAPASPSALAPEESR